MSQLIAIQGTVAAPYPKTETGLLRITKPVSGLMLSAKDSSGLQLKALKGCTLSVSVERKGKNVTICKDIKLADVMMLGTSYGDKIRVIYESTGTREVIFLRLTEDGGNLSLGENESILVELKGFTATAVDLVMYAIESPVYSVLPLQFEKKTMLSDSTEQNYDVTPFDCVSIPYNADIEEFELRYSNGVVTTMRPNEFAGICSMNGLYDEFNANSMSNLDRMVLPLSFNGYPLYITDLKIRKKTGTAIDLVFTRK